jgi:hypothetical protein
MLISIGPALARAKAGVRAGPALNPDEAPAPGAALDADIDWQMKKGTPG